MLLYYLLYHLGLLYLGDLQNFRKGCDFLQDQEHTRRALSAEIPNNVFAKRKMSVDDGRYDAEGTY